MNQRRILVAYDGSEEAYWALMHAARAAIESGVDIGVVTVLPKAFVPKLVAAGDDAARILREHELEPTLYNPTGDPATRRPRSLASPKKVTTKPSMSDGAWTGDWRAN